jgi:membrane protein DedA with SNARE-associated domain
VKQAGLAMGWTHFLSSYGVWIVAAFIALESIGLPLPAEAALMAAAFFAAKAHGPHIHSLITAGILAAIVGEVVGFWIGRKFGYRLLVKHGRRFGLSEDRIRIGQWLFVKYGGVFVFTARFLPFLRNIAAVLAGTNCMPKNTFYIASAAAAASWVFAYGLGAYALGEAFMNSASPVTISVGIIASTVVLIGVPATVARCEKSLLAKTAALDANR